MSDESDSRAAEYVRRRLMRRRCPFDDCRRCEIAYDADGVSDCLVCNSTMTPIGRLDCGHRACVTCLHARLIVDKDVFRKTYDLHENDAIAWKRPDGGPLVNPGPLVEEVLEVTRGPRPRSRSRSRSRSRPRSRPRSLPNLPELTQHCFFRCIATDCQAHAISYLPVRMELVCFGCADRFSGLKPKWCNAGVLLCGHAFCVSCLYAVRIEDRDLSISITQKKRGKFWEDFCLPCGKFASREHMLSARHVAAVQAYTRRGGKRDEASTRPGV